MPLEADEWKVYAPVRRIEMRPYVPGESLAGVTVMRGEVPALGGMVARNPRDHADRWYVNQTDFELGMEIKAVPLALSAA